MFEREMDELRKKYWVARYNRLEKELLIRTSKRTELETFESLELVLSGFGGSSCAVNILKAGNV